MRKLISFSYRCISVIFVVSWVRSVFQPHTAGIAHKSNHCSLFTSGAWDTLPYACGLYRRGFSWPGPAIGLSCMLNEAQENLVAVANWQCFEWLGVASNNALFISMGLLALNSSRSTWRLALHAVPCAVMLFHLASEQNAKVGYATCIKEPSVLLEQFWSPFNQTQVPF